MLFSRNLFVALLAVAAVGVTGSPAELVKREVIASVQWCRIPQDQNLPRRCESNGWVEPPTPSNPNCYQTGDIYWLDSFHIWPTVAGYVVCTLYSDSGCQSYAVGGITAPLGTDELGGQQLRSFKCIHGYPSNPGNGGE